MEPDISKQLADQTLYLMAISFMIGCLFTIFILVILDMLRTARETRDALNEIYEEADYGEGNSDA